MTTLTKGDNAPEIKGIDQNGNAFSSASLSGRRIILYFYPKDMTPGCTVQACDLRDSHAELQKRGFEVIGVSADSEKLHSKFIEKHDLPFTLIADTDLSLIKAFGVWGPKKFMGKEYDGIHRTTFVIGADGLIEAVITKVKTKDHTAQILEVLGEG